MPINSHCVLQECYFFLAAISLGPTGTCSIYAKSSLVQQSVSIFQMEQTNLLKMTLLKKRRQSQK